MYKIYIVPLFFRHTHLDCGFRPIDELGDVVAIRLHVRSRLGIVIAGNREIPVQLQSGILSDDEALALAKEFDRLSKSQPEVKIP